MRDGNDQADEDERDGPVTDIATGTTPSETSLGSKPSGAYHPGAHHAMWAVGPHRPSAQDVALQAAFSAGWRKNEPVRVHPESPALLAKLIEHRFGEGWQGTAGRLTRSDCLFSLWRPSPTNEDERPPVEQLMVQS